MHDAQLLDYYAAGWIPAPEETENAFCERIAAFHQLKLALNENIVEALPFAPEEKAPLTLLTEAETQTEATYGTVLRNVPVFCSSKQMPPWQAALTWICRLDEEGPLVTLIQLHPSFARKKSLLGLYDRDELLTHELAHAARAGFDEPKFEEILAYRSSKSALRRFIGPLFASTSEGLGLMVLLGGLVAFSAFNLLFPATSAASLLPYLGLLPAGMLLVLFLRLLYRQHLFHKARLNIKNAFQDNQEKRANALIYCMSDKEIEQAAQNASCLKQMAVLKDNKDASLHDRLLALLLTEGMLKGAEPSAAPVSVPVPDLLSQPEV